MEQSRFDPTREQQLVDDVLSGDRGGTEQFVRRLACVPRMLATRNARLGRPLQPDELDDVAQDTTLVVLRRLRDYQPHAPLESWMYKICCLQLRGAVRAKQRRAGRADPVVEDAVDPSARSAVDRLTDYSEAESMLERLGGIEAEVLRLKYLEGLTFAEVAARLGLLTNTAKTHHYRALARLRALLQSDRQDDPDESKEATAWSRTRRRS